jgi:NAD kinase
VLNIFTDDITYNVIKPEVDGIRPFSVKNDEHSIDLTITIGGDGTLLFAANKFENRSVPPLISVQKGTLGFLCQYPNEHFE